MKLFGPEKLEKKKYKSKKWKERGDYWESYKCEEWNRKNSTRTKYNKKETKINSLFSFITLYDTYSRYSE